MDSSQCHHTVVVSPAALSEGFLVSFTLGALNPGVYTVNVNVKIDCPVLGDSSSTVFQPPNFTAPKDENLVESPLKRMDSPEVPASTMPVSTSPSSHSSLSAAANCLVSVKRPDDWSQTEYDSPTAYSQWCRDFRKRGYPFPEKSDPVTTTPAAPSPHQDLKLETTEPYRFATPVRALMEMPSQPFDSQFDCNEFQTPTRNRSSGRKRPRIGPTAAQKQFNDDVANGLLVPDSQDESWEQYYNESPDLEEEDIIKRKQLGLYNSA
ncbi:hypothetical protein ARMSODRAFT_1084128 [Armillaria solidipes]|uniref:Uncharacterized protein n=1 Tax=Armillaria solidipes TaxID=1076256 RepID=A0A2H3B394_9AGAR|nr:hypothetical protein ARMSODRAFT_1010198 [Armillaria solidipes]PBK58321.1 hypothetical protein ARMSODRAFT_1010203 [Armillaria solidipes]PBK69989.1 hypothetical protein ARMSODRAFT_1084128 [Armillaria solidipes]